METVNFHFTHAKMAVSDRSVCQNKNSTGDEIANVNFYAVRPEATRIC